MTARRARVVLFDLGGVLLPFDQERRVAVLAHALAIDVAGARALVASGIAQRLDTGAADERDLAREMFNVSGRVVAPAEARQLWLSVFTEPNRPLWNLAAKLGTGSRIGILSDNPKFVGEAFPIDVAWDYIILSANLGLIKPAAAVFDAVQRLVGVPSNSIIFIDDREANTNAARASGWDAIHYTSNDYLAADLAKRGYQCH